MHCSVDMFL